MYSKINVNFFAAVKEIYINLAHNTAKQLTSQPYVVYFLIKLQWEPEISVI